MRSYSAISALRARLKAGRLTPSRAHRPDEFTAHAWNAEQRLRESVDSLSATRWRVVWVPAEPTPVVPRTFYLNGTHAQVMARAHSFFTSGVVVMEPALTIGGEIFDKRLNVVGRH